MIQGVDLSEPAQRISELKNPFFTDKIIRFSTYCFKSGLGGWNYGGTIEFENGDTKGEQKFKAEDFGTLLKKMEAFMASLQEAG